MKVIVSPGLASAASTWAGMGDASPSAAGSHVEAATRPAPPFPTLCSTLAGTTSKPTMRDSPVSGSGWWRTVKVRWL